MEGQQFSPEYWGEFRNHYRAVLAGAMAFAFSVGLNVYTSALFAPRLLAEFGWTKAQFALQGSFAVLLIVLLPFVGRMTDRLGVRLAMSIGVIGVPLTYAALASMNGDIRVFFLLALSLLVWGAFTSTVVCARPITERFDKARGMALACMTCAPPLVGAILAKPLGAIIASDGWRSGYWALAGISLVAGVVALAIMPPSLPTTLAVADRTAAEKKADYAQILKSPAFWLIFGGMFLINLPQTMLGPQLQLVLVGSGAASSHATTLVSLFALSVFAGRVLCGVSLDRLMPHKVAAFTLGLPALGMVMLALPSDMPMLITAAVLIMGFAQGAEGDVAPFLVGRKFDLRVFSLVLGLVSVAAVVGTSAGAGVMSATLKLTDSYVPFLLICAVATGAGALLFLMLGMKQAAP